MRRETWGPTWDRLLREYADRRDRAPAPVRRTVELTERLVREVREDRVPGLAAEVALFTLISLPALALMVLGSLGYLARALGPEGVEELHRLVYDAPEAFLSDRTYEAYADLAGQVLAEGRADVISLGAVLSLWTGSRAMNRCLETITIAYDIEQRRPGWRRRVLAVGLTVGGLVGALALLPVLVLGPRVVEWLAPDSVASATLDVLGLVYWPVLGAAAVAALATLYHVGVPWRTPWRRELPGAILAMLVWLAAAGGLRAYLAVSVGDEGLYRQLGTPIAVVLWLYVSSFAVLLGAELNAELEYDRREEAEQARSRPPSYRVEDD